MFAYFFSVLILPNKAWHKDIKLVTNTIYSCVNPCKFNLHDTKAEVSVLMSINVRSASTPDLQFCCHDPCCRQRLRKQRRMLNNDEDDKMLPKGKFSHWKKKKNGEGDGFGWVTPHRQLICIWTYIAPFILCWQRLILLSPRKSCDLPKILTSPC